MRKIVKGKEFNIRELEIQIQKSQQSQKNSLNEKQLEIQKQKLRHS